MRDLAALVIKTFMITAVLLVMLSMMQNYPAWPVIVLSLLIVGISYVFGDLFILRWTNNAIATVADWGLHTFTIWLIGPFIIGAFIPFTTAFLAGVILSVGEWFFHKYMAASVFAERQEAS
jgi:hypothetical protein